MATPIDPVRPFAIRRVAVSPGGANQVTVLEFPGARAEQVITLAAEVDMQILQEGAGAEGDVRNDDLAFPVPLGGYADFPVCGWTKGTPRILLSSGTMGGIVRVMLKDGS